jgi:hypothetical protein
MASDDVKTESDVGGALPSGRFEGRLAFEDLILKAFQNAATAGWSEVILSDADFSDWPLNQSVVIESFSAWAGTGRRLTLLANRYDDVHRLHPRFTVWRRTWDHLVEARVCDEPARGEVPSAIWSPPWMMWRTDMVHQSGYCGADRVMSVNLKEMLTERLRTSTPGFPASVLGL